MEDGVAGYTTRERVSVAVSCILGFWLDFYDLVIVVFLFTPIEKSLSIGLAQAGSITSAALLGSAVGGILFGWLGDRMGRKNALLATLGLFALGAVASGFAWSYPALLAFRFIAGIGLGGEWGAGMVLLNEVWPKERRGLGTGMVQAMASFASATAATVAVWSLGTFGPDLGWRVALVSGGAPIILMVYIRFFMPESRIWLAYRKLEAAGALPEDKRAAKMPLVEMFRGASGRYLFLAIAAWGAYVVGFQCFSPFLPTLMTKTLGASLAVVRNVTLVTGFAGSAVLILNGWWSDRGGRKLGVILPTCAAVAAYVALWLTGDIKYSGAILAWPFVWANVLWTIGQSSASMYGSWLSELFVVEVRASAVATVYTVGRALGAISPVVVPLIAGLFGGDLLSGMMFGVVGSLVCLVAAASLPETAGRSFAVIESKERTA